MEITRVDPPTRFSFTAYDNGQAFKHDFVLTPAADGTRVERTVDSPAPRGFLRVIFPLIWLLVIKPEAQ